MNMNNEMPHLDNFIAKKDDVSAAAGGKEVSGEELAEAKKEWAEMLFKEGGKKLEGEMEKTPHDTAIIKFAEQAAEGMMKRYGRERDIAVPLDHIHIFAQGGVEEFSRGEHGTGAHSTKEGSILADRNASDIDFAKTIFHEITHMKSYSAIQFVPGEGFKTYRSGLEVVSRDGKKVYFFDLQEAIVSTLEKKFYDEAVSKSELFQDEAEALKREQKEPGFFRAEEREKLDALIEQLWEKNQDTFSGKEEILDLFIRAHVTGNLLPVGRLVEKTFGKGSFRKIGENILEDNRPSSLQAQEEHREDGVPRRKEDDFQDADVIDEILTRGTPERQEALRAFHRAAPEQMQLYIELARLRQIVIKKGEEELANRIKGDPIPAEEEIRLGIYKEMLEPQVRDAVLTLERKGYAPFLSGFSGYEKQNIGFRGELPEHFAFSEELTEKLAQHEMTLAVTPGEISFSYRHLPSVEELKEAWDAIANELPDKGAPIGEAAENPHFLIQKGLEWRNISKRIDRTVDGLKKRVDEGIKSAVIAFNAAGLSTSASCEGHLDRAIPFPWINVEAPNRPQERFIGENEVWRRIAEKYGVPVEDTRRAKHKEAWQEAMKERSQTEETEEFKRWREENVRLKEKAERLLEEFYQGREDEKEEPQPARLVVDGKGPLGFRIHSGGNDYGLRSKELTEEQRKELTPRLAQYQVQMQEFAEFLKEKYFSTEL